MPCGPQESLLIREKSFPSVKVEMKDNLFKGVTYYLIHTLLLSLSLYTNKAMFELNPLISVLQFTFIRGVGSVLVSLIMGFGHLKNDLIDSIDR